MKLYALILSLAIFSEAHAVPVGNQKAPKAGTFKVLLDSAPPTLNALSSTDYSASQVQVKVMDTLLNKNVESYEFEPALAKEWKISKDELSFEFTLRDGVKWHDGKPLTIEDVKFSFDAIMDPSNKYKTASKKAYFENIKSAEITGPNKIKFTVGKPYFDNFNQIATSLMIVPMHLYKDPSKEQEKILNKTLIGTGPYMLADFDRAKGIILKANPNYWGKTDSNLKGAYNFETINMRFISEIDVAIQRMENGDLDFIELGTESYMKKTSGPKWGKEIYKVKTENKQDPGYGFIALNLTNPILSSKKTRIALAHLFNRREMIKKFLYDMSAPATGPLFQRSEYADSSVKPLEYDPKLALKLLKEDGWVAAPGETVLVKDIAGKKTPLSFTILNPSKDMEKYLTLFKEDAKKAGVNIEVKFIEWNAFLKLIDERKYEAAALSWSGGDVDWDPKPIWHSASIANAGSNYVSYKNPKVDQLIDEARVIMDKKVRVKKLREVYKMIAEDVPYLFMFTPKYKYYGYSKQIGKEKDTYQYDIGTNYWWMKKP
jgi:ABC-type transport system substrate-binding protein